MKKTLKRAAAAILAIMTFAFSFAACSGDSGGGEGKIKTSGDGAAPVTEAETGKKKLTDGLPDADMEGWTLSIVAHHDILSDESTIYAETLNGEVINDAIYQRNAAAEDRFNFVMKVSPGNGWATDYEMLRKSVVSGSADYNMCFMLPYAKGGAVIFDGYLYNMLSVENIDYNQPWWHRNVNEMFTFHSYLPFASSDYLLSSYQYANILIFNKGMADAYNTESIYDLVRAGKWTLDKFKEIIAVYSNDANGDGVRDVNDMYGFATNFGYHAITWGYAVGEVGVQLSDGGVSLGYKSEKFANLAEWLYDVLYGGTLTYEIGWDKECDIKWDENRVFIEAMWLADLEKYRDSNSEYGIVPYPKYDEAQPLYHTYLDARAGAVAIPITASDEDRSNAGMVLEALSCASYNDIIPAYLESVTHSKYTRDNDSIEMLDYIAAGRVWDIGYTFYDPGEYSWVLCRKLKASKGQIASTLASMEPGAMKYYQKLLDAYETVAGS